MPGLPLFLRRLLRLLPVERFKAVAPVVGVLRLQGVIAPATADAPIAGRLSLRALAPSIERVFGLPDLAAVALLINSPGGAPVQSALIHGRIRQLAAEKKVPVLSFVEDVAASGGYWLALAGDEIFVDDTSLLGSIGVVSAGFGVPDLLRRFGIERRVHTAGRSKSLLDPFQEEKPEDRARLRRLLDDMHESFIDLVKARRGSRLAGEEAEMFSGEVFTGRRALALGLVDGIGDLRSTLRQRFGDTVDIRSVSAPQPRFRLRLPFMTRSSLPDQLAGQLAELARVAEERVLWAQFGL